MKKVIHALIIFLIAATSCERTNEASAQGVKKFGEEIQELKSYFHIPGMAVWVQQGDQVLYEDYLGYADVKAQTKMDAHTCIPMASLTKIGTGILIQQLCEEGKLRLDDPINQYLDEKIFEDEISIAHVLSHTSQGEPGKQFYYSYRFGVLGKVLEKATGQSFESLFQTRILEPLGMDHSFLLTNEEQIKGKGVKMALPYAWEGETKAGRIEYGFSSSAGLVATVADLAKLSQAMDDPEFLSAKALHQMYTPLEDGLPYALGIFQEKIQEVQVYWGYGQYDHYSSLLLKVPEKNLTLLLAANNNLMSDPARLIYGNISYSLFALSFMKNFVFEDLGDRNLLEDEESLNQAEASLSDSQKDFYQKKWLAQAIAESFLARYQPTRMQLSKKLVETTFSHFPQREKAPDLTLLHCLSFLKTIDHHMELGGFTHFDEQIEQIGAGLLQNDPYNPYANYYLGNYFDMKGNVPRSRKYFQQIVSAPNFSPFWYTQEAKSWLDQHPQP